MSNEAGSKKAGDESTVLNLKQFAPGRSTPPPAGEEGLTVMIKKAAQETASEGRPIAVPSEGGALPPEEMLGAVSYCYAKGVYQSEEIERKLLQDTAIRQATAGEVPDAQAIRKFRRLNRKSIQATLEKAFRQRSRRDNNTPPVTPTALPAPGMPAAEANSVILSRREAEENLNRAAFVDNMLKED